MSFSFWLEELRIWREDFSSFRKILDYMIEVNRGQRSVRKKQIVFAVLFLIELAHLVLYQLSLYYEDPSLIQYDYTARIFQNKQYDIKFAAICEMVLIYLVTINFEFFTENLVAWNKAKMIILESEDALKKYPLWNPRMFLELLRQENKNKKLHLFTGYDKSDVKLFARMKPLLIWMVISIETFFYRVAYCILSK